MMKGDYRLTPVGLGAVILFLAAVVAMLVGSPGLQAAGFVVIVLIACVGAMAVLSSAGGSFTVMRRGGYGNPASIFGARADRAASLFDPEYQQTVKDGEPARADGHEDERFREPGTGPGR